MTAADLELKEKNNGIEITVPDMKMDAVLSPTNKQLHITNIITRKAHLRGNTEQLGVALQNLFNSLHNNTEKSTIITIDQFLADQGAQAGYGASIVNELVKSYGFKYDEQGVVLDKYDDDGQSLGSYLGF